MKNFVVIAIWLGSLLGAAEVALAQSRGAPLAAQGKLPAARRRARLVETAKKEDRVALSLRLAWKNG